MATKNTGTSGASRRPAVVVFLLVAAALAAFPVFSGHLYDWTSGSSAGFYLTMGLLFVAAASAFLAFWIGVAGLFGRQAPAMQYIGGEVGAPAATTERRATRAHETSEDTRKAA